MTKNKIILKFDGEFKNNVFKCFQENPRITDVLAALGRDDTNAIRQYLEEYMDQDDLKIDETLKDSGDMVIVNIKISKLNEIKSLYSYLMDNYIKVIDENEKVLEKVKHEN